MPDPEIAVGLGLAIAIGIGIEIAKDQASQRIAIQHPIPLHPCLSLPPQRTESDRHTLMLDIYCERASAAGLWAEPLNAITNLTFVVAAVLAAARLQRSPALGWRIGWDLWALTLVLAAIGIGSGLWHTLATPLGLLADVLPITLFINGYLLAFGWRALGLRWVGLLLLWLGYQGASVGLLSAVSADALNGSVGYLPALAFLLGFALWLRERYGAMARTMAAAAGLFALSLTFRTLDAVLCPLLPTGTHFLWHLLNVDGGENPRIVGG